MSPGPAVALELGSLILERFETLFSQRFQGAVDDQVYQLLGSEEATAVLAGIGVETDDNLAVVAADRLALQQTLVDRAQLLHRHFAVVDKAALSLKVLGVAQVVDDGSNFRVGQASLFQQRSGGRTEQAAVVGRESNGRIAFIDKLEKRRQAVMVVGGNRRERGSFDHSVCDVVPYPFSEAVVVVARIVNRQESPVFGVEHEEQSVKEDQRRFSDRYETLPRFLRKSLYEAGEDTLEDYTRKILRNLLLVEPSLDQGGFQEGSLGPLLKNERVATEQQLEDTEAIFVARLQQCSQVGFVVAAGAGPGTVVIETPYSTIG